MTRCSATVQIGSHRYRCKLDDEKHKSPLQSNTHVADVEYRIAGIAQEMPGEFRWHAHMAAEDLTQHPAYARGQHDYAAGHYLGLPPDGTTAREGRAYLAGWQSQIPASIPEDVKVAYLATYPHIAIFNDWDGEPRREDAHRFAVSKGLMTFNSIEGADNG